jgi:tRNA pseudouridine55 synthase
MKTGVINKNAVDPKSVVIEKLQGETPLEALEKYRVSASIPKDIPMTYAGRLDPMASGKLLILIGDECKNKDKYLGLDKEYEVEIVFGIMTDTYDALGIPVEIPQRSNLRGPTSDFSKYIGKFTQEYPPYSSKTIGGKQLHTLARANELPDEMPTKKVEIYSIEDLGDSLISGDRLLERVLNNVSKIKGDFRQEEIITRWKTLLDSNTTFSAMKLRVQCSSGTYMRSLAYRIGNDLGVGAFALSIKRTALIGLETLNK